ncbi:UDP-N-acetylglucosamine 4,6-dehydratase (inverting) [Candidatus Pelagibacter bacterium]|nr:UDP-N-acetylglucosamine 4,6-dehydratase (inverting) [Candidatus Pelagibacter bacterium]MDA8841779.1 UDP-N-acetylglucosamine 4,6-dehydratase (inverting) [Candidatus Pelagibacter bacterium]
MLKDKVILVTGGTGSFGKAYISNLILSKVKFKKIIIFSRDELKQYEMSNQKIFKDPRVRMILGDIRELNSLQRAFNDVDYVVHAAALKQVPAAEYNPFEFIKTNVLGSQNIIEAALNSNIKKVIALSTDKASSPINLYGATKLCSEKLFISANNIKGTKKISFSVVRYGNVMGSRGSVIPFFLEQYKRKEKLSLTHESMTRFNISLNEAIRLVTYSFTNCNDGEILIPKIPSFKIIDLISAITSKNDYKITGIRPGEKIHEELINSYEAKNALELKDYYVILPTNDIKKINKYCKKYSAKKVGESFCYTSENNKDYLNVKNLKQLIIKNF